MIERIHDCDSDRRIAIVERRRASGVDAEDETPRIHLPVCLRQLHAVLVSPLYARRESCGWPGPGPVVYDVIDAEERLES